MTKKGYFMRTNFENSFELGWYVYILLYELCKSYIDLEFDRILKLNDIYPYLEGFV